MCLVEIEKIQKLQTACTTEVQEGMVVHTNTERVKKARRAVLEFILINHPLDCPICDKGGECDLQNQYYEFSTAIARFTENKIFHFHRSINPNIEQDFNRCLLCKRCVRFSYEIAPDDIIIYEKRAVHTTVNTFNNRPYNSVYSGNVIELCPVGALTDRTWRFNCRPWELKHHASICNICSQHCHIDIQTRYGEIQRIFARPFEPVNDFWLCDRGRFGHQFIKSNERIREPLEKVDGKWQVISWKRAYELIIGKIKKVIDEHDSSMIAGVIENDHTLEELLAFRKLMRDIIGTIHYDSYPSLKGLRSEKGDYFLSNLPTYEQVANAEALVNLGVDLISESPLLALKIKKHFSRKEIAVFNLMAYPTEISKLIDEIIISPDKHSHVLAEIVRRVSMDERITDAIRNKILSSLSSFEPPDNSVRETIDQISHFIRNGKTSLILGRWILKRDSATLKIAKLLIELMSFFSSFPLIMPILDGGNSVGAELLKIHPRLLSDESKGTSKTAGGLGADDLLKGAMDGRIKLLLIFSHRFGMNVPSDEWKEGVGNIEYIIRADYFLSPLNDYANLLLPMASPYEKNGHLVNNEGRFDFMQHGIYPKDGITTTLEIISKIALGLGCEDDFSSNSLMKEILADERFGDKLTPSGFVFTKEERSSLARIREIIPDTMPFQSEKYPFVLISHQPFWHGDETILKSPDVAKRLPPFNVMINPDDASSRKLINGSDVEIISEHGLVKALLLINKNIPRGYVLIPEGYIERNLADLFSGKEYVAVNIKPV